MQAGSVPNDVSQNIDYVKNTLKLSSNSDFNENSEKSFKDVLSSNEMEGYETDISLNDSETCVNFDLLDDLYQFDESAIKQDMSLIDTLLINNANIVGHENFDNSSCEYTHDEDTEGNVSDSCIDGIVDCNAGVENLDTFQEGTKSINNKNNRETIVLKKEIICDVEDINHDDSTLKNDDKFLSGESSNITGNKELQIAESCDDDINTNNKDFFIKEKNKVSKELGKKYNSDKVSEKFNSTENNNVGHGINSNQNGFSEIDKQIFDFENNTEKKRSWNESSLGIVKNINSTKLIGDVDPKLQSADIKSRVISDTKGALAECIKSKDGEFDLYLKPKTLGMLKIKVSFKGNNSISVIFNATNPQAVNILKQESSDIVNMISSLGFDVNSDSLNFNFSQNNNDQNFIKHSFKGSGGSSSNVEIENINVYKKIWILNDQNVDVLV